MKINFTKAEYKTLIEMLEIASWVIDGHRADEPEELKRYNDLKQKIFSYAKKMVADDLISYDRKFQKYYATRKFEEETPVDDLMEEFENEIFWEELIERLAKRDMDELASHAFEKDDLEKIFIELHRLREKYIEEFSNNGLANLRIINAKSQSKG